MSVKDEFLVKISGPGLSLQRRVAPERVHYIVSLLLNPNSASADRAEMGVPERLAELPVSSGPSSPKAFMGLKRPKSDMERVTCLAYYLTHKRATPYFKTRDLTDLNKEAAQPQLSNATVAARNATSHQYLALAGGGSKQITTRGEALVEALPDRDKVKAALEQQPLARRKRKAKAKKK